jgi:Berberine and berberine like
MPRTDRARSSAAWPSATRAKTPAGPRPTSDRCASSARRPRTWSGACRTRSSTRLFPGALNYWKSAFFTELSDAAVALLTDAFERAPSELCALIIEEFHGAATRIAPTATAYPHREPGYNLLLISQWTDPADTEAGTAWARETFDALSPHMADRSYTNYLPADDHHRVRQAYGTNYDRLVELKRRYDPGNLYRLNQNIAP